MIRVDRQSILLCTFDPAIKFSLCETQPERLTNCYRVRVTDEPSLSVLGNRVAALQNSQRRQSIERGSRKAKPSPRLFQLGGRCRIAASIDGIKVRARARQLTSKLGRRQAVKNTI